MATTLTTRLQRHLRVSGIVQGVGFRPYVWHLARGLGLTGWVRNDPAGVEVLVEGEPGPIDAFTSRLPLEAPPLAQVRDLVWSDDPGSGEHQGFAIRESGAGQAATMIGVDAAVCPACLAELFDPADRRYRYAFINCTHCGPRYTLTHRLPYDRAQTSMAAFPLCPACAGEYRDPSDRRFHAEPTACPACGPRLWVTALEEIPSAAVPDAALPPPSLESPGPPLGKGGEAADAIGEALGRLQAGQIVAIKGLGGFHLACDARNPDAVQRLRERKQREEKPFAIMAANLTSVAPWVEVGPDERAMIESPERPICLLRKRPGADAALPGIAPGLNWLGVMLPYTPIHWLLFHAAAGGPDGTNWMAEVQGLVLVMTSANPGGEPLVTGNAEAVERLAGIADAVLMHDRDIVVRCDDSVVRWLEEIPSAAVPDAALPPPSLESPGPPLVKGGEAETPLAAVPDVAFGQGWPVSQATPGTEEVEPRWERRPRCREQPLGLTPPSLELPGPRFGTGGKDSSGGSPGTLSSGPGKVDQASREIPPFPKGGQGGIRTQTSGLTLADYAPRLKTYARELRTHQTEAEQRIWQRLRRDQLGVRFLRQRPLGEYILDFYAAALHLAVEVDGSQHLAAGGRARDQRRDAWLRSQGIRVLRFDDRQVLLETDGVVDVILRAVQQACGRIPPDPPLGKGGEDSPGGSGATCTSGAGTGDQADSDTSPVSKWTRGDFSLQAKVPTSIPPSPPLGKGGEDSPEGSGASCTPSSEKADQAGSDFPLFSKGSRGDSSLQAEVPTAIPPDPPLGKGGAGSPEGSGATCTSSPGKADQADSDIPPFSKGGRGDFSLKAAVPTSIPPRSPLGKGGEEMVRRGFTQFIRRARGYTPRAIRLPGSGPSVLALGGYLKATVCVTRGDEAFVSQHIGGLDNPATCAMLMELTDHLLDILKVEPKAVAHDLHPDFYSTRHAVELADLFGVPTVAVQHHQAHCAAVAAESGVTGPFLGLALDGVGLGDDGTAWGGELLRLDGVSYRRLGHLSPIPLPGGDRAAKEPWRMAAAALHRLGRGGEIAGRFPAQPAAGRLGQVMDLGLNCPPTTSLGRWFDAAAGLLGAREVMAYEGQAAMLLEGLAAGAHAAPMPGGWVLHPDGRLDLWPLLARLADEPDAALGAALVHATLAEGLAAWVTWAAGREGLSLVVLGGGCLLNQILSRDLTRRLGALGLTALTARQVPPNDGGLSLGQAWVAMQQIRHEELKPCA